MLHAVDVSRETSRSAAHESPEAIDEAEEYIVPTASSGQKIPRSSDQTAPGEVL